MQLSVVAAGCSRLGTAVLNCDQKWPHPDLFLRQTISAYDAMYVALAEQLDCELVTADARLSGAPGLRCAVTVLPA